MAENDDGWIGQPPRMDLDDLLRWCADRNSRRMTKQLNWWYFVRKDEDGRHSVDKLEGWRAEEARARAAGKPIEWYRATPEDTGSIHGYARRCMDQGMEPWEFREMVRRTGGAPRVAAAGELV